MVQSTIGYHEVHHVDEKHTCGDELKHDIELGKQLRNQNQVKGEIKLDTRDECWNSDNDSAGARDNHCPICLDDYGEIYLSILDLHHFDFHS